MSLERNQGVAAFCGNCGAPLIPGDSFCSRCGAAVGGQVASPQYSDQRASQNEVHDTATVQSQDQNMSPLHGQAQYALSGQNQAQSMAPGQRQAPPSGRSKTKLMVIVGAVALIGLVVAALFMSGILDTDHNGGGFPAASA